MRNNFRNYCLILALAFLQCLVPLLHAHAGGLHVSSDAHVHVGVMLAHHSVHASELKTNSCDLPVVRAASEFKRDPAADGFDDAPPATLWLAVQYSTNIVAIASPTILPYIPFRAGPPPSQAPPARG